MYQRIMVPVDLAHAGRLEKALACAADLSKHYGIPISYVGVVSTLPSGVGHRPEEYRDELKAFAKAQVESHGLISGDGEAFISHDPAVDLHHTLIEAARKVGADLIVMASHVPGLPEHVISSHAGAVASHADVSVFIVR
jgi:nucleotide-binding universal stress UspA family protein